MLGVLTDLTNRAEKERLLVLDDRYVNVAGMCGDKEFYFSY